MYKLPLGMNWYVVKIIYQIISGDGVHTPQFDEQYRLIKADEMAWALEKAQVIARLGQCLFQNDRNESVQWKLVAVEDVRPLSDVEDGALIYSQVEELNDPEEYITLTSERSKRLFETYRLKPSDRDQDMYNLPLN